MLSAAAARLAVIEALCPTKAIQDGHGFPTIARDRVFDSRSIALQELAEDADYTPTLGVFTAEANTTSRGPGSDASDGDGLTTIEIVAELAIAGDDADGPYTDAMAGDDPQARLVLEALCAQVDYVLEHSAAGIIFRRVVKRVVSTERRTFSVPQIGLRYQRVTITKACEIPVDDFDVFTGGLPEPIAGLLARLPSQSYARRKLETLSVHFKADELVPLQEVRVETGPVTSGMKP